MPRDERSKAKGYAKRRGMDAAKAWLDNASIQQRIELATYDFKYGELLRNLPARGILVPRSGDVDFSWGFFKQVKAWLYNVVRRATEHRRARLGGLARTRVFVSYSRKDVMWLQTLQTHLKPLVEDGVFDLWDDTQIRAGMDWREEVNKALASARVALLLVSSDFLASDFIQTNELPPLLEKAASGGAQVLSLIVRPCLFREHVELSRYQAVNDPTQPLSGLSTHDAETTFVHLARHMVDLVQPQDSTRSVPRKGKP